VPNSGISRTDRGRLAELEHVLADRRTVVRSTSTLGLVAELVGTDVVAVWGFDTDHHELRIANPVASGPMMSRAFFSELDRGVRTGELGFLYSPRAPEAAQRDRPFVLPSARAALELHNRALRRLGHNDQMYRSLRPGLERTIALLDRHGLADLQALRVLVCDGPHLVAHVATYSSELTPRQQRLFTATTEIVGRRELADHRLAGAGLSNSCLVAALEMIGRSAFLVDEAARVVHTNKLGELAISNERALTEQLADAVRDPGRSPFDVVRVGDGARVRFLIVRKADELVHVATSLAREHALGERTREVLGLAIAGETTKHIAVTLQIAENTVEYHLTRLYQRFGVRSRVELQRALMERIASVG